MVSISRDQLMKYGALLFILVFVGETVFLGLSNSNSAPSASGTPSPTPYSFSGQANVSGTVLALGQQGLVVCAASSGMDARLKNDSSVSNALFASADILAIQFKQNASLDSVEAQLLRSCGSPLFRSAIVDLPNADLSLNTSAGIPPVSSRQLVAYFTGQGLPGFQAYVSPKLLVGDPVNVSISVVVQDNQFVTVNGQQPESEVLALQLRHLPLVDVLSANGSRGFGNASGGSGANGSVAAVASPDATPSGSNASVA